MSEKTSPTWAGARGGGARVEIEGTRIAYDWMGKGYHPSVRLGGPDFKLGAGDAQDVPTAKVAAVAFARTVIEHERARLDRVLAALEDIHDEPEAPRPARRRKARR